MKIAHLVLSIAFSAGCTGLWIVMRMLAMLHVAYPFPRFGPGGAGNLTQGSFEAFCNAYSSWMPYLAIPAVSYALFASLRGKASVESFCVFASILALVFAILFFGVAVDGLASWIPIYE